MPRVVKVERGPLEWLRERKDRDGNPWIGNEEYAAGLRLRADFEKAQLQPRVTASWTGVPNDRTRGAPGMGLDIRERVADAQQRVRSALAAVGLDHANILLDVCCFDTGLGNVERRSGWPQRSGKVILQIALRQLARHYGFLPHHEVHGDARRAIRRWGGDGYRGSLQEWLAPDDGVAARPHGEQNPHPGGVGSADSG